MLSIKDYLLRYKRKIPNILLVWSIILAFIIISLIFINKAVTIKDYYRIQGIVKDKNVCIYVLLEDLRKIVDNNELYIDNEKYNYEINKISEDTIVNNIFFYKQVLINIDLKDKVFIDNNIIDIQFIVKEMTILEYIIDLIKGE